MMSEQEARLREELDGHHHGAALNAVYQAVTPQQWMMAHAAGREQFRQLAITTARLLLEKVRGEVTHLSTMGLTETLWPMRHAQGEAIEVRKRLVNVLLDAATQELKDCAERGPVTGKMYGKPKRPWRWRAPLRDVSGNHSGRIATLREVMAAEDQLHVARVHVTVDELAEVIAQCDPTIAFFKRRALAEAVLKKCEVVRRL